MNTPEVVATTLQVYTPILLAPVGPVVVVHPIPVTPARDHPAVPVNAGPFVGPVRVAVNVNESPRFAVVELAVTNTVGAYLLTVVVVEDAVEATAL